jgi:hypothetical protein
VNVYRIGIAVTLVRLVLTRNIAKVFIFAAESLEFNAVAHGSRRPFAIVSTNDDAVIAIAVASLHYLS